jgi:hypothetical protein
MMLRLACILASVVAATVIGTNSSIAQQAQRAQAQADPGEIRGIKLGLQAAAMATEGFGEFACGSNGGPPRQRLSGWTEFEKCAAEKNGLREVYVRFDDRKEYFARAMDDPIIARKQSGTRVAGHLVILSALFDETGHVRGIRIVTDPRADVAERRMAHLLRVRVMHRYDTEGWTCIDQPPEEGETSVGGVFVKTHCEKTIANRHIIVRSRLLRKPGQLDHDPATGEHKPGQFESSTRIEIIDPALKSS